MNPSILPITHDDEQMDLNYSITEECRNIFVPFLYRGAFCIWPGAAMPHAYTVMCWPVLGMAEVWWARCMP
jgi:hypothetical protein